MPGRKKKADLAELPEMQEINESASEENGSDTRSAFSEGEVEPPAMFAAEQQKQESFSVETDTIPERESESPARKSISVEEKIAATLQSSSTDRRALRVNAVVQFKEGEQESWKEVVEISTISKNGAALNLSNECPVGRLLSLVIQMPEELRAYDHSAPVYATMGIVQNCVGTVVDDVPIYHVGVAFIGKNVPEGFKADPRRCFRIKGLREDGLWGVVESTSKFHARDHARFWQRFEVVITLRDEATRTSRKENVFTRDVSYGGMSVYGPLDVNIGDRVKIASKEHDFYAMAIVRNRTEHKDEFQSLIHLQFDGTEFPVNKLPTLEESSADPSSATVSRALRAFENERITDLEFVK